MSKKLLITRPNHDKITSYLHDFSKEMVRTLKSDKAYHITDLEGSDANRCLFEKYISKECPKLVFLNGHGNRKNVTGYKNEVLLDNKNINLMKGKIIYALSCDSLAELGAEAIKNGTLAYIGYLASFMLVNDPSWEGSPSKDRNALPFKRACTMLIDALVSGIPVGESIEKTKEEYRRLIRSYGTSKDDPYGDTPLIRFALAWNLEFLEAEGNLSAVFN